MYIVKYIHMKIIVSRGRIACYRAASFGHLTVGWELVWMGSPPKGWGGVFLFYLLCPRLILFMQPCFILSNLRLLLVEWTPALHTRGCGSKFPTMTIGGVRPWAWNTLIRIFNVYIYIHTDLFPAGTHGIVLKPRFWPWQPGGSRHKQLPKARY